MAKIQDTTQTKPSNFIKGLNKDTDPTYIQEGMWTHARNVVNNSIEGDMGSLTNQPSNFKCPKEFPPGSTMPQVGTGATVVVARYIIGVIHLFSDKWIIYTAGHNSTGQPAMSEIGLLEEERCIYRPIVQDACLAFDKRFLITGASRLREDCTWQVYWADGLNPDRYLNVGDPQTWPSSVYTWGLNINPATTIAAYTSTVNYYLDSAGGTIQWPGVAWNEICTDSVSCTQTSPGVWPQGCPPVNACITCNPVNSLNCDKTRLASLVHTPCVKVRLGDSGGTLRNGTYYATIAYSVNGFKVGDYFSGSNTQPIWYPNDLQGSLIIDITADSEHFDEFILVIVQNVNQGTVAKQIGIYSTRTQRIELDQIKDDLITVPVRFLPLINPVIETSDQMAEVNDYLLRVGPRSKYDFNYQPLANLIQTRWTSVEYPADYYVKGGNKGSYLRDEVYAFYIRWVYNTGDKSASYHIPGRVARDYPLGSNISEISGCLDRNTLASGDRVFEVYNTANAFTTHPLVGTTTDDGGTVIAVGDMGYWQSDEQYPDDRPDIWNASEYCWTGKEGLPDPAYDLCGLNIRHHKFPDNYLNSRTLHFESNPNYMTQGNNLKIRIMGVNFENIVYPKDQDGVDIPGIVGYEILRGSREGNKSIIAKGMINNFRTYDIKGTVKRGRTGLYANYPFNTIRPAGNTTNPNDHNYQYNDPYIKVPDSNNSNNVINQTVPRDIISFHSPDTMFRTPFLSFTELKIYGNLRGASTQAFKEPDQHPKWKLISNETVAIMYVLGIAEAVYSFQGKYIVNEPPPQPIPFVDLVTNPVAYAAQYAGSLALGAATSNYEAQLIGYYNGLGTTNILNPTPTIPPIIPGGMLIDAVASIFTGARPIYGLSINAVYNTALEAAALAGTISPSYQSFTRELPKWSYLDPISRALGGLNQFLFYFNEGVDIALRGIYASIKFDQYALQMIAHGFYSSFAANNSTDTVRFRIEDASFLRDNILELPRYNIGNNPANTAYSYSINNLKRSDTVVLRTDCGVQQNNPDKGPSYIVAAANVGGGYVDQTLQTLGTVNPGGLSSLPTFQDVTKPFSQKMASHYAAVKVRLGNQYGQLFSSYQGIKQIVITPCEQTIGTTDNTFTSFQLGATCPLGGAVEQLTLERSPIFFGGDVFINRYTEKNSMFYFYDWLYGQPDGFEFNYGLRQMIPQPRFVVNSERFDSSDLLNFSGSGVTAVPVTTGFLPTQFYNMDNDNYNYSNDTVSFYPGVFRPKNSYFYLACSSVRDFFVESEVLVDFRIDGDYEWEKSYNPYTYTNLDAMFNMDPQIITRGNWYRYDYSLSISKLFNNLFSAGNLQNRYYDPTVASLCYTYYPNRIIYSLQQADMTYRGDFWLLYLINNYKDFKSKISGVKSVNKSGIFITFENDSPAMFQGVDQLQTETGTKLTIGDGGLFSQPQQSITNADKPYEYGSSQNRLSVIASPAGLYFMSQNQGKIFSYGDGLKEISQNGLKWWFNNFLPYKLTIDFPNYPYQDNPVAGIGCQSLYDNENSILYFCKRDYKLRDVYKGDVSYVPLVTERKFSVGGETLFRGQGDYFTINGKGKYLLGDPLLFEDASWTVSFDPKNDFFISFHDWHPDLIIPTKTNYLTTKTVRELFNGKQQLMADIWKHNDNPGGVCGTYCNFYGVDYPFEVEIPVATGQSVTTLKSMEYVLECYKRSEYNCFDQYHVLDFNFDRAVVYNTEQVSGYLNLNLFPKNNITLSLQYPKFNPSILVDPTYLPVPAYDVLFSKEENKYRVNQFWDITKDRGEFPIGSGYPPAGPLVPGTTTLLGNYDERQIWETGPSGYKRLLNQTNLDYTKPLLQRKKFRHYINFLSLSKMVSGDVNMILKLFNVKNQISIR